MPQAIVQDRLSMSREGSEAGVRRAVAVFSPRLLICRIAS
jgi:hypothetical protein